MPTPTQYRFLTITLSIVLSTGLFAQNVAINSTGAAPAASAMLDITSSTSGLLIPRMTSAQRSAIASPATGLMVFDTNTLGFWYYNGTAWVALSAGQNWSLAGNALTSLTGTEFIGTTNPFPLIFKINNAEYMRLETTGRFFVNVAAPTNTTSAMVVASNSTTRPTALYAYSSQASSTSNYAIHGAINNTTGNASTAAIYGEYAGINNAAGPVNNAGVRGISNNNTQGSNYNTGLNRGVHGTLANSVSYSFGVHGDVGSSSGFRVGGVLATHIGSAPAISWTSLAYRNSTGLIYYGMYTSVGSPNTTGTGTGRMSGPSSNSELPTSSNYGIGIGAYGGVMGSWISGQVYGSVFSGQRFGTYVQGLTITNNAIVQLSTPNNRSGSRIATYAATGLTQDVYAKGRAQMQNGQASVQFSADFAALIDSVEEVVVTVTPLGQSNGLYISEIGRNGFVIKENNNGTSPVAFTWIAVTTKKDAAKPVISDEIRDASFDQHLKDMMHDESESDPAPGSLWWDGQQVQFGAAPTQTSPTNNTANPRQ